MRVHLAKAFALLGEHTCGSAPLILLRRTLLALQAVGLTSDGDATTRLMWLLVKSR